MNGSCNGLCARYGGISLSKKSTWYNNGFKYCPVCTIYFATYEKRCKCCSTNLRSRPHRYGKMRLVMVKRI